VGEAIAQLEKRACDGLPHERVQALRELFALDEFECGPEQEEADDDGVA
jgi:hypothetical protein